MIQFLLQLLGARVEDASGIARASLSFRAGAEAGWFIFLLLILGGLAVLMYRRSPPGLAPSRRYVLTGLRVLFLGLLLALLLRPVLALTVEGRVRRLLVLLVDSSASMQIKDPRTEPDDQKRAALAAGLIEPARGMPPAPLPSSAMNLPPAGRIAVVRQALQNPKLNLLPRLDREFDLSIFTFGQGLVELSARQAETNAAARKGGKLDLPARFPWTGQLTATNPATALGDALREVLNRKRGQPLAGVLLVSDGANNSGGSPREAAALCRREGVPLYAYGSASPGPAILS